jgi:hypothetical protein
MVSFVQGIGHRHDTDFRQEEEADQVSKSVAQWLLGQQVCDDLAQVLKPFLPGEIWAILGQVMKPEEEEKDNLYGLLNLSKNV